LEGRERLPVLPVSAAPRLLTVWDDRFTRYDFGPGHPFTEVSRRLGVRLLEAWASESAAGRRIGWRREVEPASPEELERFHRSEYLARVERESHSQTGGLLDRGDTPSFPGCYEAAARLAGGTLAATRGAMEGPSRRAFQPGGGLHHAHPDRASGFCIFNDLAVAIADAKTHGVRRLAYIDIDVHHGDGVMYGFFEDGAVLDIDFHETGHTIFPGTGHVSETGRGDGAGLKVNVPLPPGAGDAAFQPLFGRIVPAMLRSYRPQMILLQCGADAHVGDGLGHLQYTLASYATAVSTLVDLAEELGRVPLVVTGGGGYTSESVARVLALAGRVLAGGAPPLAQEKLPAEWSEEFEAATGIVAPRTWGAHRPVERSSWSSESEATLIGELESRLGTRFPAEAPR
jgi:acetoin utilization protein AcuC